MPSRCYYFEAEVILGFLPETLTEITKLVEAGDDTSQSLNSGDGQTPPLFTKEAIMPDTKMINITHMSQMMAVEAMNERTIWVLIQDTMVHDVDVNDNNKMESVYEQL